ncbi:Rho termination factor N-terminal domain-containing protein [Geminocystis sp. GBBB08]|uniref:Rho termination factor N-terminal domain-containing protein n=1 Tax=Geminocystis sp. GBBB08 TaxID=2604140 RepID=UPI0027E23025|nr:Rho termination factor N-terminal domain-containing protein [Geminocystis sp. GBBB08]MBL1211417.1 transcription termination factor rho family protein [Geminocystis sp. GBBB08]
MKQEIGTLLHLYLDEIELKKPIETHPFLINNGAKAINEANGRNWIPLIVKQIDSDKYEVIANSFIFATAQEAGIKKVWCIVADDSLITAESAKILAQEKIVKINLATASREEIKLGLDYLIKRSINPLVGVNIATATERIERAERLSWKENLAEIPKLKCGITQGKKLNIFKEIFYLKSLVSSEESQPKLIKTEELLPQNLNKLTCQQLKVIAKERGYSGYSKMKKQELLKLLS